MYFSSFQSDATKRTAINVVRRAQSIIAKQGFLLNASKTRIAGPGHRKLVLGILVDGERPKLSREFRRRLEWHIRHCANDPSAHAQAKGFESVLGLKNHVEGLLAFARSVDPDYASKLDDLGIDWRI
jgi:hypothetical protein